MALGKDRVPSVSVWFFSFGFSRHVLGLTFPRIILALRFTEFLRIFVSCGFELPQNFYKSGFNHSMAWVSEIPMQM